MANSLSSVEVESETPIEMRVISLNYHDVVTPVNLEPTGRSAPGAWRYNVDTDEFVRHLTAIAAGTGRNPVIALDLVKTRQKPWPFLLTFDDGGISAYKHIGRLLDKFGWRGNFFISTDDIGKPGFVNSEQIRSLRRQGHVIGSHSCSHPERMSHCSWGQLVREWAESITILSNILGEQVSVASVPGGYYSRRVAEAASAAGIKTLFNSEPVTTCEYVAGCLVLGRYTVYRGTPAAVVAGIAAGRTGPRLKQLVFWKCKAIGKRVGGEAYLSIRKRIVIHRRDLQPQMDRKRSSSPG